MPAAKPSTAWKSLRAPSPWPVSLLAALLFLGERRFVTAIANSGIGRFLSAWWFAAWGFDWIYDELFVKPYLAISHVLRKDPLDQTIGLIPRMAKGGHTALSRTETGQLRWYAAIDGAGCRAGHRRHRAGSGLNMNLANLRKELSPS